MVSRQNQHLLLIAEDRLDRDAYCCMIRQIDPSFEVRGTGLDITNICDELHNAPAMTVILAKRVTMDVKAVTGLIIKLLPSTRILLIVGAGTDKATRTALLSVITCIIEQNASGEVEQSQAIRSTQLCGAIRRGVKPRQSPTSEVLSLVRDTIALSPRERDLVPLLASGLKLREAADQLNIAYKTADGYRTRLFRKLGISNRSELTRFAIRTSMIKA